ncbi:hypothetical protein TNCV_3222231 [Trichonephila clavipes]|nr:hypothetical protein TNCV_3222231 [Trichonephila clavipes]
MDHVILNHGQMTWTKPELAPPLLTTTPTGGRFSSQQIKRTSLPYTAREPPDDEGMDVIDTLEALEDKVLYLERLALELLNLPIPVPMEYITEEDSSEEDTSDDDITEEEINEAENIFKSFE